MKIKKSIIGVLLSVTMVASLVLTAVPAAAATLSYSTVTTPRPTYFQYWEDADVDVFAVAPDGMTMFAYDNVSTVLLKSTDGGKNWTGTSIGTTLNGNTVVAMAVSPNYASDKVVVAASASKVFRSANGGSSFGEVSTALLVTESQVGVGNTAITSIAVAMYYTGGELAILVGTRDTDADEGGGVFLCRLDTWTWSDLEVGGVNYPASGGGDDAVAADVLAVAFSPNHTLDAQVLAVVVGTTGAGTYAADTTYLTTKFAGNAWGADVLDGSIGAITEANLAAGSAAIAFPADYDWSSNNRVFVGTNSASTTLDDIYRVSGALPGGSTTVTDLAIGGSSTENDVYSIAVKGNYVGATVLVGLADSTSVKRTADPSLSTVTWSSSVKSPTGDAATPNTIVVITADGTAYAATGGDGGSDNSALSISTDGGVLFNGLSLIDTSENDNLIYLDSAIVNANTMFLLVLDDVDASNTITASDIQHLFKTTDGGTTWQRVWYNLSTAAAGMTILGVSPNYATDSTIYVAHTGDTRIWKSTDGGGRFIGLSAPADTGQTLTALTVVDGSTYFTGNTDGKVYRSGRFNSGSTEAASVNSIALSPTFATDDTVFVGTADGDVFYSINASATSGVTYTRLGVDDELANGASVTVIPDKDYATNKTVYAGSSTATVGINRWVVGTSTTWTQLDDNTDTLVVTGVEQAPDGALYAASNTADKGIRRVTNPTSATGFQTWESMTSQLPGGAMLENLAYIAGSNVLYAIASGITAPATAYPHGYLLTTITDTFAITPTLLSPADGASITGTSVTFSWEAISAPSGTTVTYSVEVSLDAGYANDFLAPTATTGTAYTVTGLTPGTTYWWRLYVGTGSPLITRKAGRTFIVPLSTTAQNAEVSSPAPGAKDVGLKPTFQWTAVAGATSYVIQVADNAAFTTATEKTIPGDVNVWAYDGAALKNSTIYYWRVKAVSATSASSWSVGIFTTAAPPAPPAPAPTITAPAPTVTVSVPAPTITVQAPPAPNVTVQAPPPAAPVTPGYVWAIIAIGAILVIAVIVLILRTRRVA